MGKFENVFGLHIFILDNLYYMSSNCGFWAMIILIWIISFIE